MLNYLWGFMMLAGILWSAFHGNLDAVTNGALKAAGEAVTLCITMLGVMSFWTGILEVGRRAGLIEQLSRKMRPVLHFLFPRIPKGHPALESISANIIANMLGLGWAATPAGLAAMEQLEALEEERRKFAPTERTHRDSAPATDTGEKSTPQKKTAFAQSKNGFHKASYPIFEKGTASNEMCTFLVVNISSLQLIPVNMIAYRAQYGSADPLAVVGPALLATAVSTLVGVLFCKAMR